MGLAQLLITLGGLFLLGLITDLLGRHTPLPRVTLLIVFGFAIGPSGLAWLPDPTGDWLPAVADMALVMVGFLLGETFTLARLREHGRVILTTSIAKVLVTFGFVGLGLWAAGFPPEIALILASIAPATAPAATTDVVHELRAEGSFTTSLLGIVAIDDAWGLILFSLVLASAEVLAGVGGADAIGLGLREVVGGLVLGFAVGVPAAFVTGRIARGEPTLAEALGIVFLCGGLALWFEVSFLLASMALGATVANLARHHSRPFRAIEGIEWPFLILFFVLAGASIETELIIDIAAIVLVYLLLRTLGTFLGTWLGARVSGAEASIRRWMGLALLPQAGVALGMALVVSQRIPGLDHLVLNTIVASTAILEVVGPVLTRLALRKSGDAGRAALPAESGLSESPPDR